MYLATEPLLLYHQPLSSWKLENEVVAGGHESIPGIALVLERFQAVFFENNVAFAQDAIEKMFKGGAFWRLAS